MKTTAIIVNVFLPGVGSFFVGKVVQGIMQILIYGFGVILVFTFFGAIIGIPLMLAAWVWGIVTAATANPEPIQVTIIQKSSD